jgi:transposase
MSERASTVNYKVVSIDLAKNVFQVCAFDQENRIRFNKKVSREALLSTLAQLPADLFVMEACYSSNPWARAIESLGNQGKVKLIPPHQVKPFLVGNKTDANDAVAIAEAALRPKATFVPVKTLDQQDIQSLSRVRERLIKQQTALANQIRGLLAEYGIIIPKGIRYIKSQLPLILEDAENTLQVMSRHMFSDLLDELKSLQMRIAQTEQQTTELVNHREDYQRLLTIRGVGPVTACALLSQIQDAKQFKNGRAMAAWLGLTPKQHSSGDTQKMGGISKRGNAYLRKLFIHGARTVMNWCKSKTDALSEWVKRLESKKHPCKVVVALANKLARIAWAVLSKQQDFNTNYA